MYNILTLDHQHLWHPCSQMKDYETFPPVIIEKAIGPYLYLTDGRRIIDAYSSWWSKSLGHGHPRLKQALVQQLDKFEHVSLANTTNETIVKLSIQLAKLSPSLTKVMYASDGACAIEIALKMSLHARQLLGQSERQYFMALENGYHGETGFAMSVSDLGLYRKPYETFLADKVFWLKNIPYVNTPHDPLWKDCGERWPALQAQLDQHAKKLAAIIVEPIVQAPSGMRIYSADFLRRLRYWCDANDVYLIADEIFTGLGRTGLPLACQHADIEPDFACLGKGLTGGYLPLSAVLLPDKIYNLFYDDYSTGKSFLHSHTFSGNALAAAVASECLQILEEDNIYAKVKNHEHVLFQLMNEVAESTQRLRNVRAIGAIVAADIMASPTQCAGFPIYRKAVELGALLRHLGNTIYWCLPLNAEKEVMHELQEITQKAVYAWSSVNKEDHACAL